VAVVYNANSNPDDISDVSTINNTISSNRVILNKFYTSLHNEKPFLSACSCI
jgi:hypothetical protein